MHPDIETETEKVFFMCFGEGGNSPAVKHDSLLIARQEAERLTRLTHKKVYVLKVIECVELLEVTWKTISSGEPEKENTTHGN